MTLGHRRSFITGPTAGAHLGLRRMPRTAQIHLSVPHGRHIEVPTGVLLRQSTSITPADVRALDTGLVIASWPRLLFDLSTDMRPVDQLSVIEQVLRDGHCTVDDLIAIGSRLCHPARPGSAQFEHVLGLRAWGAPVDSHPELVVLRGLLDRGVPVVAQVGDLELPGGFRVRLDLAVPAVRWAIEIDVHPSHERSPGIARDKRRDRALHLAGWQVERVAPDDLAQPARLLDELAELYRRRCRSVA